MPRKAEIVGINIRASFHLVARVREGTDVDQLLRQRIEWMGEPIGDEGCVVAMQLKDWATSKDWNAGKNGQKIKPKSEHPEGVELAALCNTKTCNFSAGGQCGVYKGCKNRT